MTDINKAKNASMFSKAVGIYTGSAILVLITATFFWAANAVAGRLAIDTISPIVLTQMRWILAFVILLPIALPHLKKDWPVIKSRLPYLFIMGASGYTMFNIILYTALTYTSAINATIEQSAMPLFIFILMTLVFRAPPRSGQVIGYFITLLGVVVTVSGGSFQALINLDVNRGDAIMMIGAFVYAAYSVALRSKPNIHWLSFLTVLVGCAAITAIPFLIYEMQTEKFIFPYNAMGWGLAVFAGVFPSIVSQACFIRGVELIGANTAGLFLNLVPIFGALLAVLVLGEQFAIYQALGLFLVIGGIFLAQRKRK